MARGDWTFRTPDGRDPSNFVFDEPAEEPAETYAERVRELYAQWAPKRTADMNRALLDSRFDPCASPSFNAYPLGKVITTCAVCGDAPGPLGGPLCVDCSKRVEDEAWEESAVIDGRPKEVDGVYTGGRRITRWTEAKAIEYREAAKKIAAEAKRKRAVVRHRAVVVEQMMAAGDGRGREEAEAEYERRLGLGHYADWVYGGPDARRRAAQKGLATTS